MNIIQTLINAYNRLTPEQKAEFQKQSRLVPLPISTKFHRTDIVVSVLAQTGIKTQKEVYQMLVDSGQFSPNCVDNDIAGWNFDNSPEYNGCVAVSGVVDKFVNDITHRDIIAEGKILQTHLQVNLYQGALIAIELVKSGAINKKGKGVIIYLTETKDGITCRLFVWRYGDGSIRVSVREVLPDREYYAGNGVLSSN